MGLGMGWSWTYVSLDLETVGNDNCREVEFKWIGYIC